jgi:hypothetical protein
LDARCRRLAAKNCRNSCLSRFTGKLPYKSHFPITARCARRSRTGAGTGRKSRRTPPFLVARTTASTRAIEEDQRVLEHRIQKKLAPYAAELTLLMGSRTYNRIASRRPIAALIMLLPAHRQVPVPTPEGAVLQSGWQICALKVRHSLDTRRSSAPPSAALLNHSAAYKAKTLSGVIGMSRRRFPVA